MNKRKLYIHVDGYPIKERRQALEKMFGSLSALPSSDLLNHVNTLENPRIEAISNATLSTVYRIVHGSIDPRAHQVEYWEVFVDGTESRNSTTLEGLGRAVDDDNLLETFDYEPLD